MRANENFMSKNWPECILILWRNGTRGPDSAWIPDPELVIVPTHESVSLAFST